MYYVNTRYYVKTKKLIISLSLNSLITICFSDVSYIFVFISLSSIWNKIFDNLEKQCSAKLRRIFHTSSVLVLPLFIRHSHNGNGLNISRGNNFPRREIFHPFEQWSHIVHHKFEQATTIACELTPNPFHSARQFLSSDILHIRTCTYLFPHIGPSGIFANLFLSNKDVPGSRYFRYFKIQLSPDRLATGLYTRIRLVLAARKRKNLSRSEELTRCFVQVGSGMSLIT